MKYQRSKLAEISKGWVGVIQALLRDTFIISKDPTEKSNKTLKLKTQKQRKIRNNTTSKDRAI